MRAPTRLTLAMAAMLVVSVSGPMDRAWAVTIAVTSTADENPTDPDNGNCTLREAIHAANNNVAEDACPPGEVFGVDTIQLRPGTYGLTVGGRGEDAGATGDLDINSPMAFVGAGARSTIVDANGIDRAFHVPSTVPDPGLAFADLTIREGDALVDADAGGAIFNEGARVSILRSALLGNAGDWGGAAANDAPGSFHIADSLVAGNRTGGEDVGGGLDLDDVVASIVNTTVSGNFARDGGGVWTSSDTTLDIQNATITGNTASRDGGGLEANGTVTMRNSIIAGNTDESTADTPDCFQTVTSQGHNLIGDATGCTFVASTGDRVGSAAAPVDPRLGPLANNGGQTATHALLRGSPAIGAGDPAAPGSGGTACGAEDQRGAPRKDCDIGAYERVLCKRVVVNRVGSAGRDSLAGTGGRDGLLGLGGKDALKGRGGADALCGGGGKDTLRGGGGKDRLAGQGGRDVCIGGGGTDKATCERERSI